MKYLLLLFIGLSACAPKIFLINPNTNLPLYQCKLPLKVYLDRSVPNYDYYTIQSELDYWNQELNTKVFILKGYTGYSPSATNILVIHALFNSSEDKKVLGRTYFYVSNDKKCVISSDIEYHADRINRNYRILDWVIRHETCHVLGIDHFNRDNDLMYPKLPGHPTNVPRVNQKQKEALKNIYNLD